MFIQSSMPLPKQIRFGFNIKSSRLMQTILVVLSCGVFGLKSAVALADGSLERVKKSGVLQVALDPAYPPMEFEESPGKITGFDCDLIEAVAGELGLKVEYQVMNWDGILAGLNSKRYDLIISSMNITPERSGQVDFVPYMKMAQVFVVRKGIVVNSPNDLMGKNVAVQADTTSHNWVLDHRSKGIALKDVKAFKTAIDAFAALNASQADVLVVDEPVGRYYVLQDALQEKGTFQISGQAMDAEPIGIAFHKQDQTLKLAVSQALDTVKNAGTFAKISQKWFGDVIPAL